jgi:AraC-like DNA-binding protein
MMPFLAVARNDRRQLERLGDVGIAPAQVADPELRVPCQVAHSLWREAVSDDGDLSLGIRASLAMDRSALDVSMLAARSCATLRAGIACGIRLMDLNDQSLAVQLIEHGQNAVWRCWRTDGTDLAVVNDFTLASTSMMIRECMTRQSDLLEVHFTHRAATDAAAYARVFGDTEIKLGMPYNALVFRRSALDEPKPRAHPGLQALYEARATALLRRLRGPESFLERVQYVIGMQLRLGDPSMTSVAHALGLSVATLRRHLQREQAVFSDMLEQVRRSLAEEQLANTNMSMNEIARSLGFAHVTAFYRAFPRWFQDATPTELRARMRAGEYIGISSADRAKPPGPRRG